MLDVMAGLLRRLDALAGRFGKWLGPAAVASGTARPGPAGGVDPGHVAAALGEIDSGKRPAAGPEVGDRCADDTADADQYLYDFLRCAHSNPWLDQCRSQKEPVRSLSRCRSASTNMRGG